MSYLTGNEVNLGIGFYYVSRLKQGKEFSSNDENKTKDKKKFSGYKNGLVEPFIIELTSFYITSYPVSPYKDIYIDWKDSDNEVKRSKCLLAIDRANLARDIIDKILSGDNYLSEEVERCNIFTSDEKARLIWHVQYYLRPELTDKGFDYKSALSMVDEFVKHIGIDLGFKFTDRLNVRNELLLPQQLLQFNNGMPPKIVQNFVDNHGNNKGREY